MKNVKKQNDKERTKVQKSELNYYEMKNHYV